jgi:putative membrane protein
MMPSDPPPPPPPPPGTPEGTRSASTADADPAQAPSEALPFVEPRRLHPASVVLGIPLAQLVQALIFPVFAGFAAGGRVTLVILTFVGVFGLIARFLDWQRRWFSFDGEVFRVDSGVLSRNHRSLDVARIQQVEIQRGPIQRLLGLAVLRVETAGSSSEPEVDLRVLPESDAVALRAAVRVSKARLAAGPAADVDPDHLGEPAQREVLRVPTKHVVLASVTGARLLVLPALIGAGFQFVGQQISAFVENWVERAVDAGIVGVGAEWFTGPDWRLILIGALVAVFLAVALAAIVGIVRDGNFRIDRVDDDLHITRGLLTTRESVVPLRRVQLVEVQRNWLRRLLGYSSIRIRSAGGSTGGEGRVTVPLLHDRRVDALLGEVLPGVDGIPTLTAHPPTALRRALWRWLRPALILLALAWFVPEYVGFLDNAVTPWVRYGAVALLPVNTVLAYVEYRHLAHGLTRLVVTARQGALSITTSLAPVVKVQAVSSRRNLFQRRLGLTTLHAHVAGPGALLEVLDAGVEDAAALHERLTEHAAVPVVGPDPEELPSRPPTLGGGEPQPA